MNKFLQLLGLAMRAGKVVSGEELVIREIRSGKAQLVILAEDAKKNTEKKKPEVEGYIMEQNREVR